MNDALCIFCQDIFRGYIDDWDARSGYGNDIESLGSEQTDEDQETSLRRTDRFLKHEPHHDSLDELQRCAELSCRLCAALWGQLSQKDHQAWKMSESNMKASGIEDDKIRLFYDLSLDLCFLSIEIDVYNAAAPSYKSHMRVTLNSYSLNQNLDMTTPYLKGLDSSTSSSRSLQQAAQWLTHCQTMHSKCRLDQTRDWLPSRLLHVGSENEPPRLCLKPSVPFGSVYNTLSHCWGSAPTLKLTIESFQSFLHEIPVTLLPKTYADAVHITRIMKVNYIWIDSLCIIQDSPEDWQVECMEMANVYRNGVLNISALHAVDSEGGCFSRRDSSLLAPLVIQSSWNGFEQSMWRLKANAVKDFEDSPLTSRAWVVQERVLSPRVLHFGKTMIHWECRELRSSECNPVPFGRQKKFYLETSIDSKSSLNQYVELWSDLVAEYSGTNLTYAKDKLVAFSAVAKSVQAASKKLTDEEWTYYAGLWEPYIEYQLLWYPLRSATSLTEYRAPSWSWAATDGVTWIPGDWYRDGKRKEPTFIHIRDIRIFHKGTDPFLEVEGGHMLLVCWLWKLDLTYPGQGKYSSAGLELIWDVDGTLESLDETTCILPIRTECDYSMEWRNSEDVVLKGLIVQRSGSQFQRKGVFNFKVAVPDRMLENLDTKKSASWIYLLGVRMYNLGIISSSPFGPPNPWISPDRYVYQLWTRYTIKLI